MSANYRKNHPSALEVSFGDSPFAELDTGEAEHHQNRSDINTVSSEFPSGEVNLRILFQPEPDTTRLHLPPSSPFCI